MKIKDSKINQFLEYYGEEASNDLYRRVDWLPGLTAIVRNFASWEQALKGIKNHTLYKQF